MRSKKKNARSVPLSMFVGAQKAKSRTARAVKDAKLMEDRVGSDSWRKMAL